MDYILAGDYERSSLEIDSDALEALYPLVFESEWGNIRIYQAVKKDD